MSNVLAKTAFLLFIISIYFFNQAMAEVTDTVSVTASRTDTSLMSSGTSFSVLDRQDIVNSNANSLIDLLRTVPGLQVNQQGSRGAVAQVRMRGAEANQILVLINGIEANDPAQGSEFNFAHLTTKQIQRVEVVRGPQSALWGSDALAGVISISTIPSQDQTSSLTAGVEAGSFATTNANVAWQHMGDTKISASLSHLNTDGTNIARNGSEDDGYENTSLDLSASRQLTQKVNLSGSLRYVDSSSDFDAIPFSTGLPADADNSTDSEQIYGRVNLRLNSFEGRYQQRLSLSRTDTDNETDTGTAINSVVRGTHDQIQYQGDILRDAHTLSIVAEYEEEAFEQRGEAFFFGDPNKNIDIDSIGLALEYRYAGDNWNLSASVRQDNNSDFDDANSYRLTASWQSPIDALSLFGSVGQANKNPTFSERFGTFDTFQGNPDLVPEESQAWEVGFRHVALNGNLLTSIAYFDATLENEINGFVFDSNTFAFTAENIDGESKRQGFEAEIDWNISDQFSLRGSYTYTDSTAEDSTGKDIDEIRRPRHVAALVGNYALQKTNINMSISYNGEQDDTFFPPFPLPQEQVTLDSFVLVNVAINHQLTEKIALTARIDNLLDEDYEEVFGFTPPGIGAYAGVRLAW
jgi:vitamin B12 transporter